MNGGVHAEREARRTVRRDHLAVAAHEFRLVVGDGPLDLVLVQGKATHVGNQWNFPAFDVLYLDGSLLLAVPLEDRKRLLRSVLREQSRVKYAAHVEGDGEAFYRAAADKPQSRSAH